MVGSWVAGVSLVDWVSLAFSSIYPSKEPGGEDVSFIFQGF